MQSEGLLRGWARAVDSTRLASSPAAMWKEGVTNADAIRTGLDLLIDRLGDLRAGLDGGEVMDVVFADAARWRADLTKSRE